MAARQPGSAPSTAGPPPRCRPAAERCPTSFALRTRPKGSTCGELAERAEQRREGGKEKGKTGAAAPKVQLRPRGTCRKCRLRRADRTPGANHAAGRWPLAAGRWPLAAGRWPLYEPEAGPMSSADPRAAPARSNRMARTPHDSLPIPRPHWRTMTFATFPAWRTLLDEPGRSPDIAVEFGQISPVKSRPGRAATAHGASWRRRVATRDGGRRSPSRGTVHRLGTPCSAAERIPFESIHRAIGAPVHRTSMKSGVRV